MSWLCKYFGHKINKMQCKQEAVLFDLPVVEEPRKPIPDDWLQLLCKSIEKAME